MRRSSTTYVRSSSSSSVFVQVPRSNSSAYESVLREIIIEKKIDHHQSSLYVRMSIRRTYDVYRNSLVAVFLCVKYHSTNTNKKKRKELQYNIRECYIMYYDIKRNNNRKRNKKKEEEKTKKNRSSSSVSQSFKKKKLF